MELPALLPKELEYANLAATDEKLFDLLIKLPPDFVLFFQYACDDETWTENHSVFIKKALNWLTEKTLEDKLLFRFTQEAAAAVRRHPRTLSSILPKNLAAEVEGGSFPISSLLWQGACQYLRILIRQECRDRQTHLLPLKDLTLVVFEAIDEFLQTGEVKNLWRKQEEEIFQVLQQAVAWDLSGLQEIAEDILRRYIARGNVIPLLLRANREKWPILKEACRAFINDLSLGAHLGECKPGHLSFEFYRFSDTALDLFEDLRAELTQLVFSEGISDEPLFSTVVRQCPKLVSLNLTRTRIFSERYADIPQDLKELDLSKCAWLNPATLKKMIEITPHLQALKLAGNTQLNHKSWAELRKLKNLQSLDLSRCHQIGEEEFKVILQACRQVRWLNLSELKKLGFRSFAQMPGLLTSLQELDLSRTSITDEALIEMLPRFGSLHVLDLTRCPNVTEKGVLEGVRGTRLLYTLILTRVAIPEESLKELHRISPYLRVVT